MNAPYVKEFPLVLECEVLKVVEIGLHTQFIGEIKDIKAMDMIEKLSKFLLAFFVDDFYRLPALGVLLS